MRHYGTPEMAPPPLQISMRILDPFSFFYGADDISITLLFFYGTLNEIESAGVKCISFLGMLR